MLNNSKLKKYKIDFAINGGKEVFSSKNVKTTMNLPAPSLDSYLKKLQFYEYENLDPINFLERSLASFHGVKNVVCFSSCFTAMALAMRALAIPGKKEVIFPSFTYRRMTDIVLWSGLTPIYCDNDPKNFGVTSFEISKVINNNTALILAPHPLVHLSDIDSIEELSLKTGIPVMFDSVEASGSTYKGRTIGSFGKAESFSLHPSKLMNSCEGGYITTNDTDLCFALKNMRAGKSSEYNNSITLGHPSEMNSYHAIMALCSLDIVEKIISKNKIQYDLYSKCLKNAKSVSLVCYEKKEKRNYKTILIKVDNSGLGRDYLHDILNKENIFARKFYYPAQHINHNKADIDNDNNFMNASLLQEQYLLLPTGHSTSYEDIETICTVIKQAEKLYG